MKRLLGGANEAQCVEVTCEQNLPNAVLLTYPDAGHGSLFQYHDSFARQAAAFLAVSSESAAF